MAWGNERLTYAELNRRANGLAHYLRQRGVETGQPVAICVERSLEMVVAILGVLKAGGAYMPIDPETPLERLGFMLEDSGATLLLCQSSMRDQLAGLAVSTVYLDADQQAIHCERAADSPPPRHAER